MMRLQGVCLILKNKIQKDMKRNKFWIFLCLILLLYSCQLQAQTSGNSYLLVIHGGAGSITASGLGVEKEKAYTEKLTHALKIGDSILQNNGTSLDAVEAAISFMEDCPLFNAGKGAVFTDDGKNELDASIMEGKDLKAGAVAGVRTIRNPIKAARKVMEKSPHVLLIGKGAEKFASEQGLRIEDTSYFFDPERWNQYQENKKKENKEKPNKEIKGTVGAVALDKYGNLAAGTSTGGMSNKKWGRVGDSPIIGAGTYANNNTCAVSCTGWGEYYIRSVAAYDVSARMEYGHQRLSDAAAAVIEKIGRMGGDGGMIAIDKEGNFTMPFNSSGMFRGYIKSDGEIKVMMYK
jgi:L-asparaginase / beta-aspartyl-peptidase